MKKILTFLLLLIGLSASAQIVLEGTTQALEVVTSTTAGIDWQISWKEITATTGDVKSNYGKITTATTTTVLSAPGSANDRKVIERASFINISTTASNTIEVQVDISGTNNRSILVTLSPGESLIFEGGTWSQKTASGKLLVVAQGAASTGLTKYMLKTGATASDATGYWYGGWKDAGIPGAWAPGSPGLAGRATNGNDVANDAGCIAFPDAGSGKARYLTAVDLSATAAHAYLFADVLWVNSGLVVTTTTGQTINSVTLPARDDNGTTNGEGCMIGIYAVAALGNAAVVSNSTVTYTNSQGTGSRTATLSAVVGSQFPATPVIGTVVWFQLQAGDTGVQSIQTVTLNTTLTSGTASVFIARPLISAPISIANQFFQSRLNNGDGIRLYDDACILPFWQSASTTAPVVQSTLTTTER